MRNLKAEGAFGRMIKHLFVQTVFLLGLVSSIPVHAQTAADAALFKGSWRQIASDAGDCPDCRITIDGGDTSLTIVANNGWSAEAFVSMRSDKPILVGSGRWKANEGSRYGGKTFDTVVGLDATTLSLTMSLESAVGKRRTIRAEFQRVDDNF